MSGSTLGAFVRTHILEEIKKDPKFVRLSFKAQEEIENLILTHNLLNTKELYKKIKAIKERDDEIRKV